MWTDLSSTCTLDTSHGMVASYVTNTSDCVMGPRPNGLYILHNLLWPYPQDQRSHNNVVMTIFEIRFIPSEERIKCLIRHILDIIIDVLKHADCVPGGAAPPPHLPRAEPGLGPDRHGRGRQPGAGPRTSGWRLTLMFIFRCSLGPL